MKKIWLIALAMLFLPSVSAVRIEEVYYDALNESGSEAVVLFNPANESIDISGWKLKSESLSVLAALPANALIKPNGYYLVADAGWSSGRDNSNWSLADFEDSLTLANTDSGIGFYDVNDNVVDKVGWGSSVGISNSMYEGTPASIVREGYSMLRRNDTNNNSADFYESIPLMRSSVWSEHQAVNTTQKAISIQLNILDYLVAVNNVSISPDEFDANGTQIIPSPGGLKEIRVVALVSHELNYSLITNITMNGNPMHVVEPVNRTSAFFEAKENISYMAAPGNYTVIITVPGSVSSRSYEVMSLTAIELDSDSIALNIKDKNTNYIIFGDRNYSTSGRPTMKNIGNTRVDAAIKSTDITSGINALGLGNIRYSFEGNDFYSLKAGVLSKEFSFAQIGLLPGGFNEVGLSIFVPGALEKGNYTGSVVVSAVAR
jgi:hypothetical protein